MADGFHVTGFFVGVVEETKNDAEPETTCAVSVTTIV